MRSNTRCWACHASSVMPLRSLRSPPAQNALCAGAGEHDASQAFEIDREVLEQLDEIEPHLGVQGIGGVRPVQRHQQT